MLIRIHHWIGQEPPHPKAIRKPMSVKDEWWIDIKSLDDILDLTENYDLMLKDNEEIGFILYLDDKGRTFRQR